MVGFRVFDVGLLVLWLVWFFRLRDADDDQPDDEGGGGGSAKGPRKPRGPGGGGGLRFPLGPGAHRQRPRRATATGRRALRGTAAMRRPYRVRCRHGCARPGRRRG